MTLLKYSFWHSFLSFLNFHFLGRPVDTLSGLTFVNQIIHKIWRLREDKFLRMPVLRNFARTNLRQWSFWKISRGWSFADGRSKGFCELSFSLRCSNTKTNRAKSFTRTNFMNTLLCAQKSFFKFESIYCFKHKISPNEVWTAIVALNPFCPEGCGGLRVALSVFWPLYFTDRALKLILDDFSSISYWTCDR